ncbi:MAG: ArsR family transcriptional regulator [Candidatus Altiarchaeota archaeon]|nr:ArsR family transcriptional regulator [Candidatus Altiarchaeota archaeon]
MELEALLDTIGNSTRRNILFLLAERPRYVSEIAEQLGVGRKAIIEHLEKLELAGVISSRKKQLMRGRPRKYFEISEELFLTISITSNFVDFSKVKSNQEIPEAEKLNLELDELELSPESERRISVSYILNKLETRLNEIESEWAEFQKLLNRSRKLLR